MEYIYVKVNDYAFDKLFETDVVSLTEVLEKLEELYFDNDRLREDLEDMREDIENNYRPLSNRELYGDIEVL